MLQGCDRKLSRPKITRREPTQIQDLIDAGVYLNASDFVRDAIRDKLAAIKVIKCRDVDYETAKKEITGYFQRKHEAYPDEISQDLKRAMHCTAQRSTLRLERWRGQQLL